MNISSVHTQKSRFELNSSPTPTQASSSLVEYINTLNMLLFLHRKFSFTFPQRKMQNALRQTFKCIAYKEWHVNKEKKTCQLVLALTLCNVSHLTTYCSRVKCFNLPSVMNYLAG